MKSTGITRQIDELGRLVLPKEIRKTYGINVKDTLEIFTEDDRIILKKYQPACIFCGEAKDAKLFEGKRICPGCLARLKEL
ncbi:MAG: AbrB/MazE/SpoVT family DNA-binding domain-containing protein [Ruminococcaceae bacterium]|nr:AbrB/MazE/SpoVT family DNA-binding domain-containing protein [Oscillospiraceae bacterium]